jgi:DNA sulfur modification protein DndB
MLENIETVDKLQGLARVKAKRYETKTVHPRLADEYLTKGWVIDKKLKNLVRIRRNKAHGNHLEDRVWTLLYKMGFTHLPREGGATLLVNLKDPNGPKTKIDVVGIDDEIAIAIECKSAENYGKRPQFQEELGKHALVRQSFANAISNQYTIDHKRQPILAMFLNNIALSDYDKDRAREANVVIFDGKDLEYYETLVSQVGPAGKYQFFSDMLPDKPIPGLRIRTPAIRTKIGGFHFYSFCISPQYLLKISFVSHRAKGKESDVNTYQRMLKKSRLDQIREYISNDGIFPTNIVINLNKESVQFERIHQETNENNDSEIGVLGWLDIRPTYKSAWIIDGQHRLFAYSGHKNAANSLLPVLAFEGLPPSKQAELFIDINAKQKRVKQSLLQELYAELHWDSDEPKVRSQAIISKAIQDLDIDPASPFHHRIQTSDDDKSPTRCISLTSIFGALEKIGFYVTKEKHGHAIEFGALWAGDSKATLKRTTFILKNWFNLVKLGAEDWWSRGSGDGGGLSMNDAVIACINVLRSVFDHLDTSGQKLVSLDDQDLFECVKKYGEVLGQYLGSLSENERKQFRSYRGVQGQTTRTRRCQEAMRNKLPDFNPPGLDSFLELEKAETNSKAKQIISDIEIKLQNLVIDELKREFGPDDSQWWIMGVPKPVRLKVIEEFEKDDGKRGGKEFYFYLIDYKIIAIKNWSIFGELLAYGNKGKQESRMAWMDFVNEQRNLLAHSSSGANISMEVLNQLQNYHDWLSNQLENVAPNGTN